MFQWYPGQRERFLKCAAQAIADTASDLASDIEESDVVPHADPAHVRSGRQAGMLERSMEVDTSRLDRLRASVAFYGPHARRAYYHPEWHFSTATNPHARGRWLDQYLAGGYKASFVFDAYRRNLRRNLRGF